MDCATEGELQFLPSLSLRLTVSKSLFRNFFLCKVDGSQCLHFSFSMWRHKHETHYWDSRKNTSHSVKSRSSFLRIGDWEGKTNLINVVKNGEMIPWKKYIGNGRKGDLQNKPFVRFVVTLRESQTSLYSTRRHLHGASFRNSWGKTSPKNVKVSVI